MYVPAILSISFQVSFEEISSSLDNVYHDEVADAIEFLESTFEIYIKDGLYFIM